MKEVEFATVVTKSAGAKDVRGESYPETLILSVSQLHGKEAFSGR